MLQDLVETVQDYIDTIENLVEEDKKRDENILFDDPKKAVMVRLLLVSICRDRLQHRF